MLGAGGQWQGRLMASQIKLCLHSWWDEGPDKCATTTLQALLHSHRVWSVSAALKMSSGPLDHPPLFVAAPFAHLYACCIPNANYFVPLDHSSVPSLSSPTHPLTYQLTHPRTQGHWLIQLIQKLSHATVFLSLRVSVIHDDYSGTSNKL